MISKLQMFALSTIELLFFFYWTLTPRVIIKDLILITAVWVLLPDCYLECFDRALKRKINVNLPGAGR